MYPSPILRHSAEGVIYQKGPRMCIPTLEAPSCSTINHARALLCLRAQGGRIQRQQEGATKQARNAEEPALLHPTTPNQALQAPVVVGDAVTTRVNPRPSTAARSEHTGVSAAARTSATSTAVTALQLGTTNVCYTELRYLETSKLLLVARIASTIPAAL